MFSVRLSAAVVWREFYLSSCWGLWFTVSDSLSTCDRRELDSFVTLHQSLMCGGVRIMFGLLLASSVIFLVCGWVRVCVFACMRAPTSSKIITWIDNRQRKPKLIKKTYLQTLPTNIKELIFSLVCLLICIYTAICLMRDCFICSLIRIFQTADV